MIRVILILVTVGFAAVAALYASGTLPRELANVIEQTVASVQSRASQKTVVAPEPATQAPPRVSVVRAREMDLIERVLVTGNVVPRREILVTPQLSTLRVSDVLVDAGDVVEERQVLARLVTYGLETQLAQNKAAIAAAEAAIARALNDIARAEAELVKAKAELKRAESLSERNIVSQSVLDDKLAVARTAEASLRAANDERRRAEAEKARTEARQRELQWERDNAEIRAPAAGLVLERDVRVGAMASPIGTPMFRIAQDSEFELEADVVETDVGRLRQGQDVEVTLLNGQDIPGVVRLVLPQIDTRTRLAKVRISLGQRTDVRNGAFARASIITESARQIAIPRGAIMYGNDLAFVYVVEGDRVAERTIVEGIGDGPLRGIDKGLNSGELVIAKAGTFLSPGDRVAAIEAPPLKLTRAR